MISKSGVEFSQRLATLMRARFPFIYIPTWEEERVTDLISVLAENTALIKSVRKVYIWTVTKGFTLNGRSIGSDTTKPIKAIEFISSSREDAVFLLKDFHIFFGASGRQPDFVVIRALRDCVSLLRSSEFKKNVIFLSTTLVLPDDMQKEISVFDFPLPDIEEIAALLDDMISHNRRLRNDLLPNEHEKLAKAALGLTLQEAENAFARAMVNDGRVSIDDISIIFDEKNQIIKKTGILEFVKTDMKIEDIGGLDNLKRWLQKRNNSWLDSAKLYSLSTPKGVLITGVPGCGKSLTAKAMSTIWKLPLLKLDIGKIFSGIVGSSEENLRQALRTAEAVAPSILWIDEIEKGFSVANGGGDAGTSSRVFGTFLTWMQDKTAPVFVIATANNINSLPPELLRKGRFDEIFFVDLPTLSERKEIFKLHLNKRLGQPEIAGDIVVNDKLLEQLATLTEGFVGAEIEHIVISALYEAFFEERALTKNDLKTVIKNTVPLSITQKEQIKSLRDWANVRAVAATAKKDMKQYHVETSQPDESTDLTMSRGGRNIDF